MQPAAVRLRQRPRRPRSLGGQLAALAGIAVVCWSIAGFALQYVRTYTLAREAAHLERRRQHLLTENAALRGEIQRLRTDDQYLEQLAREQLGMLRPGEMELVIVPQAPPPHRLTEREPRARDTAGANDRWEFLRGLAAFTLRGARDAIARVLHLFPRVAP